MAAAPKTKPKKGNKPPPPTRQELIDEALDYHKQGYSIADIAAAMKRKKIEIEGLIREGLEEIEKALPERRMAVLTEIARLQDAQKAIATNVANGEPEAIRLNRQLERELSEAKVRLDPDLREVFGSAALYEIGRLWHPTGRRPAGRPSHRPTIASTSAVRALTVANRDKETIAKIVGIDVKTLDKHYSTIMDVAKAHMLGLLVGSFIEGAIKDPRLALEGLSRQKAEGFIAPQYHTPGSGKNNGDEYNPGAGVDVPGGSSKEVVHRVIVEGGLPSGSTPEKPEGDNYSDVPPEEERR